MTRVVTSLLVDNSSCTLYELYAAYPNGNGTWHAGSGAVWNLNSNALRTDTFTSADAAGLPILPGLVRYDEVASGRIDHAIRVTVPGERQETSLAGVRHDAGTANSNLPPMGLRLRLKAQFDVSPYPHDDQVILQAMKTYGVIVADNGSPWFMSGVPDERWNNDVLQQLRTVHGSDFEAVDESSLMIDASSGATRAATPPPPAPLPVGDGPGATSTGPGTEDVFVRGFDDGLWTRHLAGSIWGPWTSLGGIITSAPSASGVDVYARGGDNALWTRHGAGPWTSLGGIITTAPAATASDLFVRGADNALWTRHLNNGAWGPWTSLGGIITTAPAASGTDVYARGADNALWTRHGTGPWTSLGGIITTAPAASGTDVYARGADNALWARHNSAPWTSLGGQLTSPPAATGNDVFARASDDALWTRESDDGLAHARRPDQ